MNNVSGWTWAAALAPALATLPTASARAGVGGWLAPLLSLPAVLAVERIMRRLEQGGLTAGFCRVLGTAAGRLLTIIYIMWAAVLGGVCLRGGVRRVEVAIASWQSPWVLAVILVLLSLWFVRGRPIWCARWGALVWYGLLAALTALALLALMQARREELLPVRMGDGNVLGAIPASLGLLGVRVYGGFLQTGEPAAGKLRRPVATYGVLALLLLTVQGVLGVELAARVEDPLLALSRNVGVTGAFQRAESLVAALLLVGDLALLSLLIWAARRGAVQAWQSCAGRRVAVGLAAAMLGVALWPMEEATARLFCQTIVLGGNLLLGVAVPVVLTLVDAWKRREKGAYIVPGNRENSTS